MITHDDNKSLSARRPGKRWLIAAALAVAAGATTLSLAGAAPGLGHHAGQARHMAMDPAALDAHIDKVVEQFTGDASPDQKARVAAIAKAAMADLRPLHEELRQAHARAHELLMAPVVDRAALEQLRAVQMQRMDAASRRILAAVEDAADVLTPEQRATLARRLREGMH